MDFKSQDPRFLSESLVFRGKRLRLLKEANEKESFDMLYPHVKGMVSNNFMEFLCK